MYWIFGDEKNFIIIFIEFIVGLIGDYGGVDIAYFFVIKSILRYLGEGMCKVVYGDF